MSDVCDVRSSHAMTVHLKCSKVRHLMELALDGNPVATADPSTYRAYVIGHIRTLRHLDLKRITDEVPWHPLASLTVLGWRHTHVTLSPLTALAGSSRWRGKRRSATTRRKITLAKF